MMAERKLVTITDCQYCPYHQIEKYYDDCWILRIKHKFHKCEKTDLYAKTSLELMEYCPLPKYDDEKEDDDEFECEVRY